MGIILRRRYRGQAAGQHYGAKILACETTPRTGSRYRVRFADGREALIPTRLVATQEFGLTPAARARLGIQIARNTDDPKPKAKAKRRFTAENGATE